MTMVLVTITLWFLVYAAARLLAPRPNKLKGEQEPSAEDILRSM